MAKRICVIGGGPSGLFAAHTAHLLNFEVELFESHSKPGGCASYFRRKTKAGTACFDAGATVLWGLRNESDLLSQLLKAWQINDIQFVAHNKLYTSLNKDDFFELDSTNCEAWIESLKTAFPNETPQLWQKMHSLSQHAKHLNKILSGSSNHIPINNLQCLKFCLPQLPSILPLLKPAIFGFTQNFEDFLIKNSASNRFKRWVDMNLLISLQDTSKNVHPLYAALALFFYPLGAGSAKGGMFQFFDSLKKSLMDKCSVHMKTPVTSIQKEKNLFYIQTQDKKHGPYDYIISSIPRFNTQELIGEKKIDSYNWVDHKENLWSALTGYVVIKDHPSLPETPFNHHAFSLKHGEFYYSFCARNDSTRAPEGHRTLSFSTHTKTEQWKDSENYKSLKESLGNHGIEVLNERFPEFEIIFKEFGTPKSFLHYTKRKDGFVGGFPLNYNYTFQNTPPIQTKIKNLYQIGDTSFPGQSIFSGAVGALLCMEKITNKRLFEQYLSF